MPTVLPIPLREVSAVNCEVLAVGTELLLGPVVDTNSTWIGERLAENGIDSFRHVIVGDNHARIVAAMREGLDRADALIVTGGLGPTQDDITRAAIAEVMGVELVFDEDVAKKIEAMFTARGRTMSTNNLLQAWRPLGSRLIEKQPGTAPGLVCEVDGKPVFLMPGVPFEMKEMMDAGVLPALREAAGSASVIKSRAVRLWGVGESDIAEMVSSHLDKLEHKGSNPTLAFLAKGIEGIHLRITAKADTDAAAARILDDEERTVRSLVGELAFGVDDQTMEFAVGELLKLRSWTLGVAESLTGGLLASRITDTPGASAWFKGGIVSYASAVKFEVLGVPTGPVVSADAAIAMAEGAARVLSTDVGLGITGVAGPTEQESQPVGTVFGAIAMPGAPTEVVRMKLRGGRQQIREMASINLLDALRKRLL